MKLDKKKFDQAQLETLLDRIFKSKDFDSIGVLIQKLKFTDVCYDTLSYLYKYFGKIETLDFVFIVLKNINADNCNKCLYYEEHLVKKIRPNKVRTLSGKVWHKLLKSKLSVDITKQCLEFLGKDGISQIGDGTILAGNIIRKFENNMEYGLYAVGAIYQLMVHHKINYEGVYDRLFELMTDDIFSSPVCLQFFDYLTLFLSAINLIKEDAIRFGKRLAELTLVCPLFYQLMLLQMIVNLIKQHPSATCLIHRSSDPEDEQHYVADLKRFSKNLSPDIPKLAMEMEFELDHIIDPRTPSQLYEHVFQETKMSEEVLSKAMTINNKKLTNYKLFLYNNICL